MGDRLRPLGRRHPITVAVAIVCSLLVVAGVVVAWQRPGFAQVPPRPVDRSVWVVNDSRLLVGRVNTGIGELDSATPLRGVSTVIQDPAGDPADPVLVVDTDKDEIQLLDTATVTFGARVAVPDDPRIALRAGTIAVADRADGRLWVGTTTGDGPGPDLSSVDARSASPVATIGALPVIAVSTAGTVFATRPGGSEIVQVDPGPDASTAPVAIALDGAPLSLGNPGTGNPGTGASAAGRTGDIQLTAIGQTPVVLDRADGSLRVDGHRIGVTLPADAVLQEPGPAAADVLIASSTGLQTVDLADGTVRSVAAAAGRPVPPVVVAGCRYAAWVSGAAITGAASCTDGAVATPAGLTGASADPTLTLQARGDAVVLTDTASDRSWIASEGFRPVDNWDDVAPDEGPADQTTTVEDPTSSDDLPQLPPDCTAVPVGAPKAVDDEFGVRAGRTTVLRVLDNDPGVDCTSVIVESVSPLPADVGTVAVVGHGTAVQITVSPAAATVPSIEYTVGNGQGATATARITVGVVPAGKTAPAERVRRSAATAEVDGTVSYNVLDDMVSPVGDDLFLISAATDTADVVSFRPDGTITYRNTGGGAGTDVSVEFVVSDGVEQATGTLTVSVVPAGSSAPVIYPAYGRTVLGTPAMVDLRRSVVSGSPDPVVIDAVQPELGSEPATAVLDRRTGSVSVSATEPGSFYFTFEANAGGRGTTGVLRVDVAGSADTAAPAVPMLDVAYLPAGGETVLDPLANDSDPGGRGLAVRDVQETAGTVLAAAVVDLRLVRISAARPLRRPVELTYTVFDGVATPSGLIRVIPVPAPRLAPPPLTAPVQATVRAGDAVTIPFTSFTTSQDGSPVAVTVDPVQVGALPGPVFVTADSIRYLAPADSAPGQLSFGYTASSGSATALAPAQAAGTVAITVTAADPSRNRPPGAPSPVTARVFAGGAITVSVPLAGIDPDGDWVTLQSIEQPEAPLGEVRVTGADTLSYTAFGTPGVDRIRYVAADPNGATATGELTVLVVAPTDAARPPAAPDLTASVRPGGSIRIDPLAAVVDPGGQPVRLADPAFTVTDGLDVQVEDQSFILTAPAEPTVGTLRYTVVNAKGLTATGTVRVTVSPDAPMPDPLAKDVFVQPADLTADTDTVDVDLRGSVTNRGGRSDELTLSVDPLSAGNATLVDGRTIRVTMSSVRQIVAYRVVDANGGRAGAFVVVPPRAQLVGPQLRAGVGPIALDAGLSVDVTIGDYVTVGGAGQNPVTIAPDPAPRITQGSVERTSATTLTLSAPSTAGGSAAVYVPIVAGSGPPVVLSIPVRIEPRLVPPPKLDSTTVPVEAGTSASVDLAALTTTHDDRQAGSVSWGVDPGGSGVTATVRGSTVTVAAAADVPRGTRVDLPMDVTDGDGKNGRGTLTVTVTGSTKPLPTVVDQLVGQGRGGAPVSVDMLTGSDDPVGLGLTVSGVRVLDGAAGIGSGPTVSGGTVALTPAAGFVGEIVVAADVLDGTKDPDRQVTATLRVEIQDRPSAPGVPAAVPGTVTARSVQLQWQAADANGAPVQAYTVTGGGIRQDCPGSTSSCVIGGLIPGQAYVFVVTATNSVGESAPSAPSAVIIPDVAPSTPGPPVAQYVTRGEISVSWSTPVGDFTPVSVMSLQVLRGGDVVQVIDSATSPTVLTGLDAAGSYRFQVRAANQQGFSDWSAPSDAMVPSGVPSAPTDLGTQFIFDAGRRGVQVGWGPPGDDGGEPIASYRLTVNGVEAGTGDGGWRSAFVPLDGNDQVTIAVTARNGRGEGPPATGTVAPFGRPAQVTGLALTAGDSSLGASWNPADSPGRPIADYQYRVDGGSWVGVGAATSTTIGSLANGTQYRVEVRACNGESGFSDDVRCGLAADPKSGTPAGPLIAPKVTVAVPDTWGSIVQVDWSFPGGNGRDVVSQKVTINGTDVAPSPAQWRTDVGYGATVTATVQYCVGSGPARECKDATGTGSTADLFTVATQALAPLAGTCAVPDPYDGEWRTEATCAPGTWVPAPTAADLLCVRPGPSYPEFPAGNPAPSPFRSVNVWYQDKNRLWYRKPVFLSADSKIPTC